MTSEPPETQNTDDLFGRRTAFYDTHYDPIAWVFLKGPPKILIGRKEPRSCRYCGKAKPAVTFRKEAHAFPELIGNRVLIALDECDSCNELFSTTVEDNFAKFTGLQRVASPIRGKDGIPSFKSNDKKTRWDAVPGGGAHIATDHGSEIVKIDLERRKVTVAAVRQPYIPRFAFKCVVKMALAVMPEPDLAHYRKALDWLLIADPMKDPYKAGPFKLLHTFVNGSPPFQDIFYTLLRRKTDTLAVPFYSFVVAFGNYTYQAFLPLSDKDSHITGNITLEYFPNVFEAHPQRKVSHYCLDLSSLEIVRNDPHSVTYAFDSYVKTPGGKTGASEGGAAPQPS